MVSHGRAGDQRACTCPALSAAASEWLAEEVLRLIMTTSAQHGSATSARTRVDSPSVNHLNYRWYKVWKPLSLKLKQASAVLGVAPKDLQNLVQFKVLRPNPPRQLLLVDNRRLLEAKVALYLEGVARYID